MWAKISNSATSMACAACIVAAATLPWAGSAAEKLATEDLRLAAITDIDAFSGIPSILAVLNGDVTELANLDSLSAIPSILALLNGDTAAVNDLDSVNGIPALLDLAGGDINTLFPDDSNPTSGYDALSAIDIFFGDGADGEGGVISDGNFDGLSNYDALSALPAYRDLAQATNADEAIDALGEIDAFSALPIFRDVANADSLAGNSPTSVASILGGYDALSALDTFFGDGPNNTGGVFTGGGLGALTPDADGNGGYAALSAIPAYLNIPPTPAPPAAPLTLARTAAPQQEQSTLTQDPAPAKSPVKQFVAALPKPKDLSPAPRVFTPPAPPKEEPKVEAVAAVDPDDGGQNQQNVQRTSEKFTPKGIDGKPILFGSGTPGVDNGIRGWGDMLKKAGLGGADTEGAGQGGE